MKLVEVINEPVQERFFNFQPVAPVNGDTSIDENTSSMNEE